jgi:hypothetical protein
MMGSESDLLRGASMEDYVGTYLGAARVWRRGVFEARRIVGAPSVRETDDVGIGRKIGGGSPGILGAVIVVDDLDDELEVLIGAIHERQRYRAPITLPSDGKGAPGVQVILVVGEGDGGEDVCRHRAEHDQKHGKDIRP